MPTIVPETSASDPQSVEKSEWLKPAVVTLDTWEAEGQDGSGTDSSGFVS
jgi:hypothetical protein